MVDFLKALNKKCLILALMRHRHETHWFLYKVIKYGYLPLMILEIVD
jgi:hypothetical protein